MKRLSVLAVMALVSVVVIGACAPVPAAPSPTVATQPTAAPQATGVPQPTAAPAATSAPAPAALKVVVGHASEDVSLDPVLTNATNWLSMLGNMYDTLVVRGRDGKLVPSLAESWKIVDNTTVELKIRQGVKFHKGQTFDANDVKFTLDRVLDEATKSQLRTYVSKIKEVQAVDPTTVKLTLSSPEPLIVENLQFISMVSSAFVKEKGAPALANDENGTGPYRLVEWKKGDHLTMEAAPGNWRGTPKATTATFRVIPELASLVAALQVGEIDIALNFPPDSVKAVASASNFKVVPVRSQRSIYLVLDNMVKPLDDVRVRQALNYGTNVQEITDGLLLGNGEPLATMVGSMYYGYSDNLKPYGYNPDKAKQLLAEAGYKDGFSITFRAPTGRYVKDKEVAEAIVGQWSKIGVKADLKLSEWGAFLDAYRAHQLSPVYLIGFGTPVWDFQLPFTSYLLPSASQSYYRNAEVQKLVQEATTTVDPEKRKLLLQDINTRIYNDAAFVFLYLQKDLYGVSNRIDWTPRSDEKVWLFEVNPK